ncbi:hypothetical protein [Marispirochaeta sp.]|jgi:hypothetical protein|uniref:hypothetical protein n=1 Tax=Marispirochaeta sp. TaxID=2038653 RepID=UPI0029C9A338|nr:hypothetical protein [Marispirochaeta sp.]
MKLYMRAGLFILLYAAICIMLAAGRPAEGPLQIWPEWYTLVTHDGAGLEERLAPEVAILSPRTLQLSINGFGSMLHIPLEGVEERLSSRDPRIDPFIRALPSLFRATWQGKEADVLYIQRDISPRNLEDLLKEENLGPDDAFLVDTSRPSNLPLVIIFLLLALPVLFLQPCHRLLSAFMLLPWGIGILFSGRDAAFLALLALFILPRLVALIVPFLLRRYHDKETILEPAFRYEAVLLALGLFIGMAMYGAFVSFTDFLRFPFSAALAALGLLRFRLLIEEFRQQNLIHPLFMPVDLVYSGEKAGRMSLQAVAAAAGMLLVLLLPAGPEDTELKLPVPVEVALPSQDLDRSLQLLSKLGQENGTPSLTLYLTHRYYQENYMYGPAFTLPELNGELSIGSYRRDEGRILSGRNTVWRFTDIWYKDIISNDTDRIIDFFIHEGIPKGILRTSITFGRTPVYGVYTGFGLLFSFAAIRLFQGARGRRQLIGCSNRRFEPRRMSQTA